MQQIGPNIISPQQVQKKLEEQVQENNGLKILLGEEYYKRRTYEQYIIQLEAHSKQLEEKIQELERKTE